MLNRWTIYQEIVIRHNTTHSKIFDEIGHWKIRKIKKSLVFFDWIGKFRWIKNKIFDLRTTLLNVKNFYVVKKLVFAQGIYQICHFVASCKDAIHNIFDG